MNKMVSIVEFEQQVVSLPTMTRREKLLRWAQIVRATTKNFYIFNGLEYWTPDQLSVGLGDWAPASSTTAFAAAASDSILRDAGLKGDTPAESMRFFELSQSELHEFSCDCGGAISNTEMARRIEGLAVR